MTELLEIILIIVVLLALSSLLITMSNMRFLDSLEDQFQERTFGKLHGFVSILIPARNEEENIKVCLQELMRQRYEPLEILVLDDQSTDNTAKVVQEFSRNDSRIRLISGETLPDGWIGKNWACHQLSKEAKGEFFLFIDADTVLSSGSISSAISNMITKDSGLLTVLPQRMSGCLLEKLMFPFLDWVSFCWLPMKRAHGSRNAHLSATFGQFMLFTREVYAAVGGHETLRDNPLDDFELGRATKRLGFKWTLFDGTDSVRVLPYKGNIDAFKGVSRSVFPAIYHRFTVLLAASILLLSLGILPILILTISFVSHPQELFELCIAATSIGLISLTWFMMCVRFSRNYMIILFYPLAIGLMVLIGFHSMLTYRFGQTTWKNRKLQI